LLCGARRFSLRELAFKDSHDFRIHRSAVSSGKILQLRTHPIRQSNDYAIQRSAGVVFNHGHNSDVMMTSSNTTIFRRVNPNSVIVLLFSLRHDDIMELL